MPPVLSPNETARLACLRSLDVLDTEPEEIFDDVVQLAAGLTGCPVAIVALIDECRHWFKAKVGMDGSEQPREATFCQYVVAEDRAIVIPNTRKDARFADHPYVSGPYNLQFYAGFPIVVEGLAIGTLCVGDTRPRRLAAAKFAALEALARQAAALMESRRVERRAVAVEGRFSAFMDHVPALAFLKDDVGRMQYVNQRFERLFHVAPGELLGKQDEEWLPVEAATQTVAHDRAMLESGRAMEVIETVPTADGVLREWSVQRFPVEMVGSTWVGGLAMDVTEIREARRAAQAERDFSEAVLGNGAALICVVDRQGRIVRFNAECERITGWTAEEVRGCEFWDVVYDAESGAEAKAWYAALSPGMFPMAHERAWTTRMGEKRTIEWRSTVLLDHAGEVEFVVGTGVDITLRREQERALWRQRRALREANARLRRLATTDELTRIANRLAFRRRLTVEMARAERTGAALSVAMVDVDLFKQFNDEFGHAAGDETLRGVARVLREASRELDLAARYGGEEFVVLMPATAGTEAAAAAERLRCAIEGAEWPHRLVTASLGVATLRLGSSAAEFVADADRALYASKAAGRNRVTHADGLGLRIAA